MTPAPDRREQRWSELHHGLDPSSVALLRPWLRFAWWLARGLRGVPPTAITALGVVVAAAAAVLAGPAPWVAAALVVVAVLCDALDGAVAVLASTASHIGALADAVADRICDVLFAVVLWRCGAPWWLAVLAGASALGVDGLRRALRVPTRITVAERPTFTICAVLACGSSAVTSASWPPLVCAVVWVAAAAVGLAQLAR